MFYSSETHPDFCMILAIISTVLVLPTIVHAQCATDRFNGARIETNEYNVSQIYADDTYSLAYANGYAQARDRLFQLDALRHIGHGNSATVLGVGQLKSDLQVTRNMYTKEEMKKQYETAPEIMKVGLRGFADGVNHWMCEVGIFGYPAEFYLLGHTPRRWKPVDSIAVANYLIGFFGVSGGDEVMNARTVAKMSERFDNAKKAYSAYEDLNWLQVKDSHTTSIPAADKVLNYDREPLSFDAMPDKQWEFIQSAKDAQKWGVDPKAIPKTSQLTKNTDVPENKIDSIRQSIPTSNRHAKIGSNAMIIGGSHTESGHPIMWGGPQMGYFKPPPLYEVGLHGAGFDVTGAAIAGIPGVVMGRTEQFVWSVTSGRGDQRDVVAVELHPDNRHKYKWNGEWKSMKCHTVTHDVSTLASTLEGNPTTKEIDQEVCRIHEYGDVMPVTHWNPNERVAWAERRTTWMQEIKAGASWIKLGKQESLDGVKDVLNDYPVSFNVNFAGPENISFMHLGKLPIRNTKYDPRFAFPGGEKMWNDTIQGFELGTHYDNPDRDFLLSWNNAPMHGWRAGDNEQAHGTVHRANGLETMATRMVENNDNLTLSDIVKLLERSASHDSIASSIIPHIVWASGKSDDPKIRKMGKALKEWGDDGYMWEDENNDGLYDHPGHAIYDTVRHRLQKLVYQDEAGELTPELHFNPQESSDPHAGDHGRVHDPRGRSPWTSTLVDIMEGNTTHDWFNNIHTSDRETGKEIILKALRQSRSRLSDRYDTSRISKWLHPVHESRFKPMGLVSPEYIEMVNKDSWNFIASVTDSKPFPSRSALPPGNYGYYSLGTFLNPFQGEPDGIHNQLEMYANYEFKNMPNDKETIKSEAESTERLKPGGSAEQDETTEDRTTF